MHASRRDKDREGVEAGRGWVEVVSKVNAYKERDGKEGGGEERGRKGEQEIGEVVAEYTSGQLSRL